VWVFRGSLVGGVTAPDGRVNWTLLDGTEVSEIAQKSGKSYIKVTFE